MKKKSAFILSVLTFALVMPMFGQDVEETNTKTDIKKNAVSEMPPPPVFEATTAGIHLKVWILAKGEELKENDLTTEKVGTEGVTGTHHIMVEAKDAASGKEVDATNAKILVKSPSNKTSSVELKTMMNQLGGNLDLTEKGEYQFTVSLYANGKPNSTPFKYTVR